MKITPIRILMDNTKLGLGTGRDKGCEIYPTTPTLLNHFNLEPFDYVELDSLQHKTLDKLPELDTLNNLREYQLEDVKFLAARKCAACFNEQRTGKTPTALSTMAVKGVDKLLIVAPASTLYSWARECRNWYKGYPIIVVDGTQKKRETQIDSWISGALIISYECLRETTHTVKNEYGEIEEIYTTGDLSRIKQHKDITGVILDEAHRIKNHKSKQAEAMFSLINMIPNRLALTGTPAPGKQHEIYSILHWLYPQVFTGYWRFIDYYFTQYEEYNANGKYKVIGTFKPGKAKELQEYLDVISTRRLRASVMSWLPEKDREVIKLPQTTEQQKYIQELNDNFEIEGTDVDAINILAKIIKVRQILLHPQVLGLKGKSPKSEWIKQYLKDYPDKKVLVFSNFTEWLKLLGKELDCNNFIIGETPKTKREELKNKFQSGEINLLLINIKAGKEGITLDNADVAIFTDKYPPVGDIQQAEDRFVATTKDKLNTGHTIIDLVMDNSYEVNILRMLDNNASEVDIINNYINYIKEVK